MMKGKHYTCFKEDIDDSTRSLFAIPRSTFHSLLTYSLHEGCHLASIGLHHFSWYNQWSRSAVYPANSTVSWIWDWPCLHPSFLWDLPLKTFANTHAKISKFQLKIHNNLHVHMWNPQFSLIPQICALLYVVVNIIVYSFKYSLKAWCIGWGIHNKVGSSRGGTSWHAKCSVQRDQPPPPITQKINYLP